MQNNMAYYPLTWRKMIAPRFNIEEDDCSARGTAEKVQKEVRHTEEHMSKQYQDTPGNTLKHILKSVNFNIEEDDCSARGTAEKVQKEMRHTAEHMSKQYQDTSGNTLKHFLKSENAAHRAQGAERRTSRNSLNPTNDF
jgi:hypothetical protein